jgi:hypothetical protein
MPDTFRGKAEFAGCAMVFDVVLFATGAIQDATVTQNYEVEKVQDSFGADISKRGRNELLDLDVNMKLIGDTAANARALNTISPGGFLPMLQTVNISQPVSGPQMPAVFIGGWQMKPGSKISAKNAACGEMMLPLETYADATQRALMLTTPG